MDVSLLELWDKMGWFARGIVGVLAIMSIVVVNTALRKLLQMYVARSATLRFAPGFAQALRAGDFAQANRLVVAHPQSHIAASFHGVLPLEGDVSLPLPAADIAAMERLIELNALEQLAALRRGLGVLATVGATAPFVGLLGTTMGVVHAFKGMAAAGTGGIAAISTGIAEALIVTAFGLLVAIPAVWLYNYFATRIEYVSMEIKHAAQRQLDVLARSRTVPLVPAG